VQAAQITRGAAQKKIKKITKKESLENNDLQ